MKYIYDFTKFDKNVFENVSSVATKAHRDIEIDSKKIGIDWEDENIQKLICDELIKKVENSKGKLDLRIDVAEVAQRASAPSVPSSDRPSAPLKTFKKESFIFESTSQDEFSESLKTIQERLKEADIPEFDEENILRKLEAERLSEKYPDDISPKESKESWIDSVKAAIKWLKENKFAKNTIKVISKIIDIILFLPRFILRVLQSSFNWILRSVFGFSHESTSKTAKLFFPIVSLCFVIFLLLPLISTGILVFSGVGILKALCTFSIGSTFSYGLIFRGLYRLFFSWIARYRLEPLEEMFTCLEYLDELEKISGRKLKISLDTRTSLEKLDSTIGFELHKKKNRKFEPIEISNFLKNDIEFIKKNGLENVKISLPVFRKIISGEQIVKKDYEALMDVFIKRGRFNYYETELKN